MMPPSHDSPGILICSVNWLGDCCMSMPAIQAWKALHPDQPITLLVKRHLASLWQCHPDINTILPLAPGNLGPLRTGGTLRKQRFSEAYVFPNSWRAALPPFVAGIPRRTGFSGHLRSILMTDIVPAPPEAEHQQYEYAHILGLSADTNLPMPQLQLPPPPDAIRQQAGTHPLVGILPGAARGPAKRWPTQHFIDAAKILQKQKNAYFAILGTAAEAPLCREITTALAPHATCLAGNTSLPELAASLQHCDGVLSNDSGGMHLAAAVGTPVVAMFGLTNPAKTGPIGAYTRCLQPEGVQGSRRIPRESSEAEQLLASITPDDAAQALLDLMQVKGSHT